MNKPCLFNLALMVGVLAACNDIQDPVYQATNAPEKAALVHFCNQMAQGPSEAITALPAEQRQAAWMSEMAEAATSASIQGWSSFQSALAAHPPNEKQAWIELGVTTHGLQTECAVLLKR